jgi:small-conductance mechanosensitive channel
MFTFMLLTAVTLLGQQVQLPAPSRPTSESVEVRYGRAQLQLAEANLDRVNQSNKQLERSVPSSIVAEYQDDVRVAKTRLQQATAGRSADEFQVWLERAEAEWRSAQTTWTNAKEVNRSAPDTFVPIDVERFRLRAEVAKLQLERGQALAGAGREAQLQWQSDLLDNQVQRLKEETRYGTQSVGLYPRWWW